jgi:hypothetical protein
MGRCSLLPPILEIPVPWPNTLQRLSPQSDVNFLLHDNSRRRPGTTLFLGAFAKLRKATISCVMSVRLSVRMEQLGSHWTDFHEILYSRIFRKSAEKIQVSLKSDNNNRYFTWRSINIFIISRSFLFAMRNVSDKSCGENQNTHFVCSNFSPKIVPFMR